MKALSLKECAWIECGTNLPKPGPSYMEEVAIIGDYDNDYYILAEYPYPGVYWKNNFLLLGDHNERARLEEWQEGQLTQVDRMLQLCADMMPEVEMEPGAFERVWDAVKQTL